MWHRQMLSYGRKKMLKTGETSVGEPPEMTLHNMRFVIKMLLHGLDYSLLKNV